MRALIEVCLATVTSSLSVLASMSLVQAALDAQRAVGRLAGRLRAEARRPLEGSRSVAVAVGQLTEP